MFDVATFGSSIQEFFITELKQNELGAYLTSLCIALGGLGFVGVARYFVTKRLNRWMHQTAANGRVNKKLVARLVNAILVLFFLMPCYWAFASLTFSKGLTTAVGFVFLVLFTVSMVRVLANLLSFVVDLMMRKEDRDSKGAGALMPIIRTVVWIIGLVFLLDNLGFQISSIVAGLGIMGVAVGLAGQAILADFFSYLVIIMDKPFALGDVISIGDQVGTVERIGIKTTLVRTNAGEVLVCPNGELTKQRIGNLYPATQRARTIRFGIAYETPLAQVRAVPDMVQEAAASAPGLVIDRVHLVELGEYSLNYECLCHVSGRDIGPLLNAQQSFLLALMERFAEENIIFAYPTSTVHVQKEACAG